jgi:hypothetical protein
MDLRDFVLFVSLAGIAGAQPAASQPTDHQPKLKTRSEVSQPPRRPDPENLGPVLVLPVGTKVPLQLRQPVSTKGATAGDPIYAQTTFPVVAEGMIVIPAGTWVQGVVDTVKRAGRIKGTAELQFHLTKLIYANGYMLNIAGALDQIPGDAGASVKEPGIAKQNSEKAKDLERVGQGASTAGQIGALAGVAAHPNARGFGVGGLTGVAAGTLIGLLARGSDVTFPTGTAVEIALPQVMSVDRGSAARALSSGQ